MQKLKKIGPLFIIMTALLWSFDRLLRISLYSLPPAVIVFYEHLLGASILLFISFKWVGDIVILFGTIDVLINNAGIWTDNEIEITNPLRRKEALETNTLGNIQFTDEVLPHF